MNVKHCVSCAGCVRIFEKPLLSIIYYPIALSKRENRVEGIKIKKYIESFIKPDTFDTPDTRQSVSEKITVIYYLCRKTCEQFDSVHRSLLFT